MKPLYHFSASNLPSNVMESEIFGIGISIWTTR